MTLTTLRSLVQSTPVTAEQRRLVPALMAALDLAQEACAIPRTGHLAEQVYDFKQALAALSDREGG